MKEVPTVEPSPKIPQHKRLTRQSSSFGADPVLVHKKHSISPFFHLTHGKKKNANKSKPMKSKSFKLSQKAAVGTVGGSKNEPFASSKVYAFDDDTGDTSIDFDTDMSTPTSVSASASSSGKHSVKDENANAGKVCSYH